MKTKVSRAKCGYTEIVFRVGENEFVLSREYKSGQPMFYWFNVSINGDIINFDIRNLGIDVDEFTEFLLENKTLQVLYKVRDFLIQIENLVEKLNGAKWQQAA